MILEVLYNLYDSMILFFHPSAVVDLIESDEQWASEVDKELLAWFYLEGGKENDCSWRLTLGVWCHRCSGSRDLSEQPSDARSVEQYHQGIAKVDLMLLRLLPVNILGLQAVVPCLFIKQAVSTSGHHKAGHHKPASLTTLVLVWSWQLTVLMILILPLHHMCISTVY